jgi:hypothetical protein
MANVLLWNTVILDPLASVGDLRNVDISGFSNGVVCNIPGAGNFYYNISSVATDNGITVLQPTSGSGRWLIQKPAVSNTYKILGQTTGSPGPVAELPITALGYSIMNAASAAAIRTAAGAVSTTGSNAAGTWPINITGYCANLIGAVTSSAGVTSIATGAVNYSNLQNVSAGKKLLGNYNVASHAIQEISLGENLTLSDGGVLNALGTAGALLRSQNLADLISVSSSRTNLGLGTVAVKAASDVSKTTVPMISSFTSGNYAKFDSVGSLVDGGGNPASGDLLAANNLSELSGTASTARGNLGLGAVSVKGLTDASKSSAVMLSTFTDGNYAKFDSNGSLVDGGSAVAIVRNNVTSSTQVQMVVNQAYYFTGDFNASLLLPASAAIGDTVYIDNTLTYNVVGKTIIINQNASQFITLGGGTVTTAGVGGSLKNTIYGTTWALRCIDTDNNWLLTLVTVPSIFITGIAVAAFVPV